MAEDALPSKELSITPDPLGQGLTLVHFSAQRKRFLWDKEVHAVVV